MVGKVKIMGEQASEFAVDLAEKVLMEDHAETIRRVDAELQEVRAVLNLFEKEWMTPHDYEHEIGAIPEAAPCDQCELSKRARALMEKLEIRP